ncbi:MAG: hypothetical protein U0414_23590 [Polyangiaceae bacterium]
MTRLTVLALPALVALGGATEARADALPVEPALIQLPHVSAQPATRVRSSGMIAGGVVLSVLGLAGSVLGVVALVVQCTGSTCGANEVIGGTSLGLSLATEITGIVLISVGATPRPMVTELERAPHLAAPQPEVFRLSLRGLGLRMSF